MHVSFTFRNLESSEALKEYASEKIAKLQKLLRAPIEADVVASVERHLHCIDVTIHAGGKRYAGREESEDMYASIDKVADKIDAQVRRDKSADTQKRRSGAGLANEKK